MQKYSLPLVILGVFVVLLVGCAQEKPYPNPENVYRAALLDITQQKLKPATEALQKIILEQSGSSYANFAQLKSADLLLEDQREYFLTPKSNVATQLRYNLFVRGNQNSVLAPYVLSRLIYSSLVSIRTQSGTVALDRDQKPFLDVIDEYYRFLLLYPQDAYLQSLAYVPQFSENSLAKQEIQIANWYFERRLYRAAINRYTYVLKQFPAFTNTKVLSARIIRAHEILQNTRELEELKRAYFEVYNEAYSG